MSGSSKNNKLLKGEVIVGGKQSNTLVLSQHHIYLRGSSSNGNSSGSNPGNMTPSSLSIPLLSIYKITYDLTSLAFSLILSTTGSANNSNNNDNSPQDIHLRVRKIEHLAKWVLLINAAYSKLLKQQSNKNENSKGGNNNSNSNSSSSRNDSLIPVNELKSILKILYFDGYTGGVIRYLAKPATDKDSNSNSNTTGPLVEEEWIYTSDGRLQRVDTTNNNNRYPIYSWDGHTLCFKSHVGKWNGLQLQYYNTTSDNSDHPSPRIEYQYSSLGQEYISSQLQTWRWAANSVLTPKYQHSEYIIISGGLIPHPVVMLLQLMRAERDQEYMDLQVALLLSIAFISITRYQLSFLFLPFLFYLFISSLIEIQED